MCGRTGKTEAQLVQAPLSLSKAPHQKQSVVIAITHTVAVLAALASVGILPVQGAGMLHCTVLNGAPRSMPRNDTHLGSPTRMS
jgi:hypothetical protein